MNQEAKEIKLGGKKLTLVFTAQALREVKNKFGGIKELGEAMDDGSEMAGSTTAWLTTLLANQGIEIQNLFFGDKGSLLTEVEITRLLLAKSGISVPKDGKIDIGKAMRLCAPSVLIKMKNISMKAVTNGMLRQLEDIDEEEDEVLSEIKNGEGAAGK